MAQLRQGCTVSKQLSLADLGWRPFFQQQLSIEEWYDARPARIVEQHRSGFDAVSERGQHTLAVTATMPALTAGDWVLLDPDFRFVRALERQSSFRRRAAGSKPSEQLVAANIDTAFIVCSLNEDYNLSRLERYLSLVHQAGSEPVVVLSKKDLCPDPDALVEAVQALDCRLCVVAVDSLARETVEILRPWCQPGSTVVLLGSSGVGKSTLANTLCGQQVQDTGEIREDDAKGRHTTTRRSLLTLPAGGLLLDTPGMRELQLADCAEGVTATFADVEEFARQCRFGDCRHENEPGCAVRTALDCGELEERRLANYRKLQREQALNSASLAERRARERARGRYYHKVQRGKKLLKGDDFR